MSEKTLKAKWNGKDAQKVRGVGLFLPGEAIEITPAQAEILKGVNDERFEISDASSKKASKKEEK